MLDCFQILCGLVVVALSYYYYYTATFDFWKNRNVRGPKPMVFFGNMKNTAFKKASMAEHIKSMYDQHKDQPVFGIFDGRAPTLVVTDLELVKNVLIRDFSLFSTRGLSYFKRGEPIGEHLFFMEPERWRPLRSKFSTIFSSGNLKGMFQLILKCSTDLENYMDKVIGDGGVVECRELAGKYTTDVIANCMFGLDISTLPNEDSEFCEIGRRVYKPCKTMALRDGLKEFLPGLYDWVGNMIQPEGVLEYFTRAMIDTMKYREEKKIFRPDLMNVIMDMHQNPDKVKTVEFTEQLLANQGFGFFVAGFKNTSLTIAYALYEMAQNHDIQDRLRAEIQEDYEKNGETLTYDRIKGLKYLDMVYKETLRKHPVLPTLFRGNLEDYTFKGTDITIPKGTALWIPVYAIHRDPNHYPDPEKFDPERFTKEAEAARHPMSFIPFGDGPRNCIGARFSDNQVKLGIMAILRKYKVDVCKETTLPFEHEKLAVTVILKGGVNLKLSKVQC